MSEKRCEWQKCRKQGVVLSRWSNGATAWHCADHHEGVAISLSRPDVAPDLNEQQRAGVLAATLRFNRAMQKLVDQGGIDRLPVSVRAEEVTE